MQTAFRSERPKQPLAASHMDADQWLLHLFSSRAAVQGAVVRRKARDVDSIVGWDRFLAEVRRRGFQAVLNGGQVIVFCNAEPLRILTEHPER